MYIVYIGRVPMPTPTGKRLDGPKHLSTRRPLSDLLFYILNKTFWGR